MDELSLNAEVILVSILGAAVFALGLVGRVVPSQTSLTGWLAGAGLAAAGVTVLLAKLGYGWNVWLPPLGLAVMGIVFGAVRSTKAAPASSVADPWIGRERWLWVLLACAGPALTGGSVHQLTTTPRPDEVLPDLSAAAKKYTFPPVTDVGDCTARTDCGKTVQLYTVLDEHVHFTELLADESEFVHSILQPVPGGTLQPLVMRTAPADPRHNCHGWIFTGGRYLIQDNDVPKIILDNGYARVPTPAVGDLIVYRDTAGHCIHTGIVRVADPGGLVLVESKWGVMGRYLHPPRLQPYGTRYDFCRSPRTGHLLAGLTPATRQD